MVGGGGSCGVGVVAVACMCMFLYKLLHRSRTKYSTELTKASKVFHPLLFNLKQMFLDAFLWVRI